jgi:hypothetical protein
MDKVTLIRTFYTWYLKNIKEDNRLPFRSQYRGVFLKYISEGFYNNIVHITENEGDNADPFLCAQDYFLDWSHNIGIEEESPISFLLTFHYGTDMTHMIRITLISVNHMWRINSATLFEETV